MKTINGKKVLLELALGADFALIKAHKADRWGNLVYRGSSRTFNETMAGAARVTIAEVDEVVELGELDPEESSSLSEILARTPGWSPLVALSLVIFTIFYAPCFVTVVMIVRESGSWKWGIFSMAFNSVLALVLATLVFQIGSVMGVLG